MALFNRTILTNKGKELISKVMAKKIKMIFTKIEATDFIYREQVNLNELTRLENPKQSALISNVINKNNKVTLQTVFTNENLTRGYSINAIGVYAKEENGTEILFSVLVASEADFIPAKQSNNLTTINYDLIYAISNSEMITITVENNALATAEMFSREREERIAADNLLKIEINTKEPAIIKKTGFNLDKTDSPENDSNKLFTAKGAKNLDDKKLDKSEAWKNNYKLIGNTSTVTDLNDITEPGEYANPANAYKFANSPVTNTAFTLSVLSINPNEHYYRTQILMTHNTEEIYKRVKKNTSWTEWWRVDSRAINWNNLPGKPQTTLAGYGIKDFKVQEITTEDLNQIRTTGIYMCGSSSYATTGRNYPVTEAGTLEVFGVFSSMCTQRYTSISGKTYIRNLYFDNPSRAEWVRVDSGGCPYKIGDIYTTTNTSNPSVIWVGTTWQKIEGRFLRATTSGENAGINGGSDSKTLTIANLPSHTHNGSTNEAGEHTHTQSAHSHTQPAHKHAMSTDYSGSSRMSGFASNSGDRFGWTDKYTQSAGGENTGTATPAIQSSGRHSHSITIGNTGSGTAFDIKPAYFTVHIWKRVS